jgi:hypothetical protein
VAVKKIMFSALVLALGAGVGGSAAFGVARVLGGEPLFKPAETPDVFVPIGAVLAPLVHEDGRLAGYASFEVQVEVKGDHDELVARNVPLLLNAINMRTYRTPMTSGPGGQIPRLDAFRKVVMEAALEVYGPGIVRRAAVMKAAPI